MVSSVHCTAGALLEVGHPRQSFLQSELSRRHRLEKGGLDVGGEHPTARELWGARVRDQRRVNEEAPEQQTLLGDMTLN